MHTSPTPPTLRTAAPSRQRLQLARSLALATCLTTATLPAEGFRWAQVTTNSLGLWEGSHPVLVYNHGMIHKEGVPQDRTRSSYVHPIYGLDGEVLTDDFPADHYHHRGLFWAWPHVRIDGREYDLWMIKGIEQRFVRWHDRRTDTREALLDVENGWFVGDAQVATERLRLRVQTVENDARALDVDLRWTPVGRDITLVGAEGKSYGGLTLRYAAGTHLVITTPLGTGAEDLAMTRLPWADLSARFEGRPTPSGAAVFVAPDHPDYPPTWLTRHYGVLCVGWPGVTSRTFPAGQPFGGRYRIWIHRGQPSQDALTRAYSTYTRMQQRTQP